MAGILHWRRVGACVVAAAALALCGDHGAGAAVPPALTEVSVVGEPPTGEGVFRFPQALATAPDGRTVYVADQYSGIVQRFGLDGTPLGAFGGFPTRLGPIGGLATDQAGRVYVLDSANGRVRIFTAEGRLLRSWGRRGMFRLAMPGGGPAFGISASGIAVAQGTPAAAPVVYIADQGFGRVERIRLSPQTLRPAGRIVVSSPALRLAWPQGIGVDPSAGRVYVADDGHDRVVVLRADTLASVAQAGHRGRGRGGLDHPYDVSVDLAGRLYVADNLNNRVAMFSTRTLAPLGSLGGFGRGIGWFSIVRAVAALRDDPRGGVVVADTANNRIQVMGPDGRVRAAWGIAGRGPGHVTNPHGVAVTPGGGVAVADTFDHRIERFHSDGTYAGQLGRVSPYNGYTTAAPGPGGLDLPTAVAYDARGRAWVADPGSARVVEFGRGGRVLRRLSLPGARALAAGPHSSVLVAEARAGRVLRIGAGGRASVIRRGVRRPVALAVRPGGGLYLATVSRLTGPGGRLVPPPGGGRWGRLAGLAYDRRSGALYVAELRRGGRSRVLRRRRGGRWETIARAGPGAGDLVEPSGLALSPGGRTLIVADRGAQRVLRFDARGAAPSPPRRLQVSVSPLVGGTVTATEPGIACPTDCSQHFRAGRVIALVARPGPGRAVRWGGDCAAAGAAARCVVRMDAARVVSVSFPRRGAA